MLQHQVEVMIELKTDNQFKEIISKVQLVVADFFATWCGPCKAKASIVRYIFHNFCFLILQFAKVSKELTDITFLKVNGDEFEDLIEEYEVSGYPTFALFKGGKLLNSKSGKMDEEALKKCIKSFDKSEK